MATVQYSVSSSEYKSSIFTGFSRLQKDEEFVDLTLAADGCFIKVHKNLIALASPYLRDILRSLSGQSPALFLNNVSAKVLSYILEYIYQGEVDVPLESVDAFIEVCKSLQIVGIQDIQLSKPLSDMIPPELSRKLAERRLNQDVQLSKPLSDMVPPELSRKLPERRNSTVAAHITINNGQLKVDHFENENCRQENDINETVSNIDDQYSIRIQAHDAQSNNHSENIISYQSHQQNLSDVDEMQTDAFDNNMQQDDNTYENQYTNSQVQDIPVIEAPVTMPHGTNTKHDLRVIKKCPKYSLMILNNKPQLIREETSEMQNTMQHIEIKPVTADQNIGNSTSAAITSESITKGNAIIDPAVNDPPIPQNKIINILSDSLPMDATKVPSIKDCLIDFKDLSRMAQYSVTERGAIQLILNRYIYCCHHQSRMKRRWRCIDYRSSKCPASVDTVDGAIVARIGVHSHTYHDNKIYKKHRQCLIFQTVELAASNLKKKEPCVTVIESE